jgi:hypothetical protein
VPDGNNVYVSHKIVITGCTKPMDIATSLSHLPVSEISLAQMQNIGPNWNQRAGPTIPSLPLASVNLSVGLSDPTAESTDKLARSFTSETHGRSLHINSSQSDCCGVKSLSLAFTEGQAQNGAQKELSGTLVSQLTADSSTASTASSANISPSVFSRGSASSLSRSCFTAALNM